MFVIIGDGLRGLGLLNSAVHGATSIAFTYANGKKEMSNTMLVGSECGAVFALQPLTATKVKEAGDWDDEARKMLGYVNEGSRDLVRAHVERWAKLNQSHSGKIDPEAVFRSKPDPDLLFNAAVTGRTKFEPHAGPVLSVDASPFHRNVFASAGADGVLKISSTLQARPILSLDPNAGISLYHSLLSFSHICSYRPPGRRFGRSSAQCVMVSHSATGPRRLLLPGSVLRLRSREVHLSAHSQAHQGQAPALLQLQPQNEVLPRARMGRWTGVGA